MPRFIVKNITLLLIALAISLGTAIAMGRQQPVPDDIALLHLTDCKLPCWIGITPGITSVEETQARITAVYGESQQTQVSNWGFEDKLTITKRIPDPNRPVSLSIAWSANDSVVDKLAVTTDIFLPDLIDLLGLPTEVTNIYSGGARLLVLRYTGVDADISSPTWIFDSTTINLRDRVNRLEFTDHQSNDDSLRWRGFGRTYRFDKLVYP